MFRGYGWAILFFLLFTFVFFVLPLIPFFYELPLTLIYVPPLALSFEPPLIFSLEPPFLLSFKPPLNFAELRSFMFAIGGLLFSIPLLLTWQVYIRPVLKIDENIERKIFNLSEDPQNAKAITWTYEANRIIIKNTGRSAARNCKGWIVTKNRGKEVGQERVRWTVLPSGKTKTDITINVRDKERLDFCAYYKQGTKVYPPTGGQGSKKVPEIIAPTEEEWPIPTEARSLDDLIECEVWVTSENAEPAKAKVKFIEKEKKIEIEPI